MGLIEYTEIDFQTALERNYRGLTRGKTPIKRPIAILLGGQSGAGKTTIHRIKQSHYNGNIIIIDGDTFRLQHPKFIDIQKEYGKKSVEYTNEFAGRMVESLIELLSEQHYHLLIEGTLRTVDVPRRTAVSLKSKGYQVELSLIATKPYLSYLSTLLRYEQNYSISPKYARATPKKYHDNIVGNLVENLNILEKEKIFDRIQIFKRDKSCVYDSYKNGELMASEKLHELLYGVWDLKEKEMLEYCENELKILREAKRK